jgi:type VI secretion system protein ImpG
MSVTTQVPPPIGENLLWRLVSNLSRNFGSLVDVGALRTIIASYDFRAVHDAQARRRLELLLEGLESFESSIEDGLMRGMPVRVRRIVLSAAESKVGGEAELFLLGSVLERFFSVYASINSLHRFAIRGSESKVDYLWPLRTGTTSAI